MSDIKKKNNAINTVLYEDYTDAQLLDFLEENNFEASFTNLCVLKEGLANGTIVLEAKKEEDEAAETKTVEDAPVEEEVKVEKEAPIEEPRVAVSIPVDGSMEINSQGKTVVADAEGNVQCSITESHKFLNNKNAEFLLKSYLTEDCGMELNEFMQLSEDTKTMTVKEIAINLLSSVEEKLNIIDTSVADSSRGDIKSLISRIPVQKAIQDLQSIIERDENTRPEYSEAINTVIKAVLYINQYSQVFKDAYRNKKTIMILKYQSLILSIISTISYLISTIVDYSNGEVKLKATAQEIQEFAPLEALRTFNKSVDNGEFKILTRDNNALREYYLEVPVETMGKILEAYEYVPMIVDGIKNIYNKLTNSDTVNKMAGYLYQAVGVITLLFSLREVIYTLFRMKTKVSDMQTFIQNFVNMNSGGNILTKLSQFANKFKVDAEYGSEMSKREIDDENKRMLGQVRQIQANNSAPIISNDYEDKTSETSNDNNPANNQQPVPSQNDAFGFDF